MTNTTDPTAYAHLHRECGPDCCITGDECPPFEDEPQDIWAMLERPAPAGCGAVQDLYSWSLNYDAGTGPFALFLDLIGWSDDNIGEPVFGTEMARLGHEELRRLSGALAEYVDQPYTVAEYVDALMAAEAR